MRRLFAVALGFVIGAVMPNVVLGHYWFQRPVLGTPVTVRGTPTTGVPVLSASSSSQFFCRSPSGNQTFSGPHSTLAAAEAACTLTSPQNQDGPQRVVFEVTTQNETVTTTTPITTTTARTNVYGGSTLKVSDAHAQLLIISSSGGTSGQESDTTPDQFTFTDQTDVELSTTITSAAITVAGINSAATITVSGGTYDINSSGSFTSSSGTVSNGDTVRARHTSSSSNSTAVDTTVTIGGVSDTFTSTTLAAAPPEGSSACTGQSNLHYIRDGGTGDGSAWDNALDQLPTSYTRGHSYYVADGTYNGDTLNTAESSTTVINICKATVADHGTDAGWQDTYGDGQAVFGNFSVTTDYWVVDGAVRDEDDWFDGDAYGFAIGNPASFGGQLDLSSTGRPSHLEFKYIHVRGYSGTMPSSDSHIYAIDHGEGDVGGDLTDVLYHRVYVSNSGNSWFLRNSNNITVEYSAAAGPRSNADNHGEVFNLYFGVEDIVIRYNKVKDAYVGNGGTALIAICCGSDDIEIYGNIFWNFDTTDAAIGFGGSQSSDPDASNMTIVHNTFVDRAGGFNGGIVQSQGSGNVVQNNLWFNTGTTSLGVGSGGTISHNATSASSLGGSNNQLNLSSSIFVNYAGEDYRLASDTTAGATLGAPYNVDLLGNTRTTFSRGAYQYVAP